VTSAGQLSRIDDPRKMKPDICAAMAAWSGRASEGKRAWSSTETPKINANVNRTA
jgi:hypothetical protein